MADEKQLAKLKESPKVWNEWKSQQQDDQIVNLSGAKLSGANLNRTDLSGGDLRDANLTNADLRGSNLNQADLSSADLRSAKLTGAYLRDSKLNRVNLIGVNLSGADLCGADLCGADLSGADLSGVFLNRANLIRADLNQANLRSVDLSDANLRGANLSGANLSCTNLQNADLIGAKLTSSILNFTIFGNTRLAGLSGLEEINYHGPCTIDHKTIERSGDLPDIFLRGCGLSEMLIDYLPSVLNQPISFYSCFISYSHEDKVFAQRLHDQLQGQGIRCWLDDHQILPGDDIYKQVDQGIKLWDKVLLCASENSLSSWWVDNEIDATFHKEQQLMNQRKEKVLSLIPLNLDGHMFSGKWKNGKAGQVKSRLAADFTGWETNNDIFEQAFEKVVKALKTDDAGREIPPKPIL